MAQRTADAPGSQQGVIDILDFSGGLNIKSSPFQVAKNQATILQNWYIVQDGSLLGRGGTARFNATSLGAAPIQGSIRAMVGSNSWLVSFAGTIYKGSDGAGTFASSLTGLNTTALSTFTQYLSFVYWASQSDAMHKFDGTTWSLAGIAAPVSAPTASSTGSGPLTGTYTFEYTYVTATAESNPSTASNSVTPSGQNVALSGVTVGPTGTTARNIYGFKNGISSTYQLIGTINDNTTTTFSVTVDEPSWGVAAPTENTPPLTGPWILVQWKNRIWSTGWSTNPQNLYFSEVFEPEVWPTTYFIAIPFIGSDKCTALLPLGDLLLVWGLQQLYYIFGATPFTFVVEQSFAENGAVSPWAVIRVSNAGVYLGQFGIFAFDGATETTLSDPIEPQFTGVGTTLTPMSLANAETYATMAYYNKLKAFIVSFPTTGPQNDTTYWHFLDRHAWVQDTRPSRMLLIKFDDNSLWSWDANAGILREWDTGTSDDGAAIVKTYQSGAFAGPTVDSTQRYGWMTMRGQPNNSMPQITAIIDQGQVTDTMVLAFGTNSGLIGSAVIGTATIQANIVQLQERWNANCIGDNIQLQVIINDTSQPKMYGITQRYTIQGEPRYFGSNA